MQAPQRRAIATAAAAGLLAVLTGAGGVEASIPRPEASAELAAWPPALADAPTLVDLELALAPPATTTAPAAAAATDDRFGLFDPGPGTGLFAAGRPSARARLEAETRLRVHDLEPPLHVELEPLEVAERTGFAVFGRPGTRRGSENRWYDPELGRLVSTDPLGYVDGPNLYGYAGNNPVNYSDPMGLYCMRWFGNEDTKCTDYFPEIGGGRLRQERVELIARSRDKSISQAERNAAALKVNAQIPLWLSEEAGVFLYNSILHQWAVDWDEGTALEERVAELHAENPEATFFDIDENLRKEGYEGYPVKGGMPTIGPRRGLLRQLARSEAPAGAARLLPQFSRSSIDDVVAGAAQARGQTTLGARAIAKKLGRAEREGFTSAFEGLQPTQANAEAIIRETLSNPTRTFVGERVIDVYGVGGRGVRYDRATGRFITFLEESLATQ